MTDFGRQLIRCATLNGIKYSPLKNAPEVQEWQLRLHNRFIERGGEYNAKLGRYEVPYPYSLTNY